MKIWNGALLASLVSASFATAWAEDRLEDVEAKSKSQITVKLDDGKVRVTGPDGKEQVIDAGEGNSGISTFQFNQMSPDGVKAIQKTFVIGPDGKWQAVENSEQAESAKQGKFSIRASVIGPDGKEEKIELGPGELPEQFRRMFDEGFPFGGRRWHTAAPSRYWLGIHLAPANAELQAGKQLEESVGIRIAGVEDETPASKAGIEPGDVIMAIDGKPLKRVRRLVAAVQKAGKEDQPLKLTLDRHGETHQVQVKPLKRADIAWARTQPGISGHLPQRMRALLEAMPADALPGRVVQQPDRTEETSQLKAEIESLRKEVEALKKQLKTSAE